MPKQQVTIIIPTKNEAEGLHGVIKSVKKYCDELIVVDGNSNDGTKEISADSGVKFLLDHGKGRGEAVRFAIGKARGDIVVLFDSDGSHNASDVPNLIKEIEKGADLVICSRRTGGSFDYESSVSGMVRSIGSDLMAYLVNKKFNTQITDILYSFRAVKKNTALKLKLQADGFDLEQELVIRSLQERCKVVEIPSRENARKWGKSKLQTYMGAMLFYKLVKLLYF